MVNQKFLIFDYDDTIMPSNITKTLSDDVDYGAEKVKDKLEGFYRFLVYWKRTTGIPIIILSAGTIAYIHLISLYGKFLRISINYFDPRVDICMFIPIPFNAILGQQNSYLKLTNNNAVSQTLQNNMIKYYFTVLSKYPNSNYYLIHPTQIESAISTSNSQLADNKSREFINGLSHRKVVYVQGTIQTATAANTFFLPGTGYNNAIGFYEFLNSRRQFKNLDSLRKHFSFVLSKPTTSIHFYFFDDRASHLGMGDQDIYLSKPHAYPSSFFVSKLLPIFESLMHKHEQCQKNETSRECMRKNENKLLKQLVDKLAVTDKLVFVSKHNGASPVAKRTKAKSSTTVKQYKVPT